MVLAVGTVMCGECGVSDVLDDIAIVAHVLAGAGAVVAAIDAANSDVIAAGQRIGTTSSGGGQVPWPATCAAWGGANPTPPS